MMSSPCLLKLLNDFRPPWKIYFGARTTARTEHISHKLRIVIALSTRRPCSSFGTPKNQTVFRGPCTSKDRCVHIPVAGSSTNNPNSLNCLSKSPKIFTPTSGKQIVRTTVWFLHHICRALGEGERFTFPLPHLTYQPENFIVLKFLEWR